MAVTANQLIARADRRLANYPLAASTHVYQGTLVFLAAGYALGSIGASGGNVFGGIAVAESDNSLGSAGDTKLDCWIEGAFELVGSGFTQADVGKPVYATDNYTINTLGNGVRIGKCLSYVSATRLLVLIEVEHGEQPFTSNVETLAGAKTIAAGDPMIQVLDPGGSGRNVFLPDEEISKGRVYIIHNAADAAEVLTIKNDEGTNICTPTQNESAFVYCDGVAWRGLVGASN